MKAHRPERVANVIRDVVSSAISHKLSDPRISVMASVTRVEVSKDLEHAKVFISVMGDEREQGLTLSGLASAAGYVQRMVGRQLTIRHCPHLTFHPDVSIKKGAEMLRLIDEVKREREEANPSSEEEEAGGTDSMGLSFGDSA